MAASPSKLSELALSEERTARWLLVPTFVILFCLAIYPLGRVFYLSFTNKRFASDQAVEMVGFQNYRDLLSVTVRELPKKLDENGQPILKDGKPEYELWTRVLPREPRRYRAAWEFDFFGKRYVIGATNADFIRSVWDTIVFTIIAVALETILGLMIALALARRFFGRGAMRTAMLIPWAIITVVSSLIWEWMFKSDRSGLFTMLLNRLGFIEDSGQITWLVNPALQLPSAIAIDVWKTTPFMALLLLAGLSTIPKELYEAANVDGASRIRQFFSLTLPLLMPTLSVALIFRTLDSLRVFDLFQIVFGENRYSMATFTQFALVAQRDMGLSSAVSVIIFIILFALYILYENI
ncbi:MAG: sugar ABC transporter permease [Deinococcales bacterium]